MIQKYSTYKILELFFDFPTKIFGVREISRISKLAQPSVKLHLDRLIKDKLVIKVKDRLYGGYKAHRESDLFKLLKQQNCVLRLNTYGVIQYIIDTIQPRTIILFGSCSRGEDIETSDVDIFIEADEEKVNLKRYEEKMNRGINLFFKRKFEMLSIELKNNIINGVKLYGYLEVFE